jgi:outer membrane protein assembly factor BamA
MFGAGGLFTDNESRGVAIGARLYLKEDKYRVTFAGGHASINVDLYGVGKPSGDRGLSVLVNTKGTAFFTEPLFQIRQNIYLGGRFQYRNLRLSIDHDTETNPPAEIADIVDIIRPDLFRQATVAVGPRFQWDTRDNKFYPRRGAFLDSGIDLFLTAIGSEFTYQYFEASVNKYIALGDHQVVAVRGMGCAAAGDRVPIYDLCLFGFQNDLRGYPAGRYQERRMFATQAEYRFTIPKPGFLGRFGLVAFGGVGGIGPKFTEIEFSDMLPAGGGGIRFRLTRKNLINFRIDYGVGKTGGALIVGVGEAF